MSEALQPSFLAWLLTNVSGATLKGQLVDTDYTHSSAHDFLDDVPSGSRVGSAVTIATVSPTDGVLEASGGVTFPNVTNTEDVQGLMLYIDAGSDPARRLVGFHRRNAANEAILFTPVGTDLLVSWPGGLLEI